MLRKIFSKVTGKSEQRLKDEALRRAAIKGRLWRAKRLIAQGADPNSQDVNKLTPVYFAAMDGHADVLRLLLEHGGRANMNAPDSFGSCLGAAAVFNHVDAAKALIEHGADLNGPRAFMDRTPLHVCADKGYAELAALLLKAGADPNTKDDLGHTPLYAAMSGGHADIAVDLVRNGTDLAVRSQRGLGARQEAARRGQDTVIAAIDERLRADAEREQQAAREREKTAAALEKAPVLQNNIAVKKPLTLQRRQL
jgi:ankyrin repeat protein